MGRTKRTKWKCCINIREKSRRASCQWNSSSKAKARSPHYKFWQLVLVFGICASCCSTGSQEERKSIRIVWRCNSSWMRNPITNNSLGRSESQERRNTRVHSFYCLPLLYTFTHSIGRRRKRDGRVSKKNVTWDTSEYIHSDVFFRN